MACKYCYFGRPCKEWKSTSRHSSSPINIETFKKAIQTLLNYNRSFKGFYRIEFMGGEPLLRKSFLLKAIEHLYKLKKKRNLSLLCFIVTNGTLLDDDFIRRVSEYEDMIHIQISIDGTKHSHDRMRKFREGNDSTYDVIIKNVKKLIRHRIPLSCRVTIGRWNTDIYNGLKTFLRIGIPRWSLGFAITGQREFDLSLKETKSLLKNMDRVLSDEDLGMDALLPSGFDIHYDRGIEALYNTSSLYACRGEHFAHAALGCDGFFYACTAVVGNKRFRIGHYLRGIDVDSLEQLAIMYDKSFFPSCTSCPIRKLCGGPCLYELEHNNMLCKPEHCQIKRHQTALALQKTLHHNQTS